MERLGYFRRKIEKLVSVSITWYAYDKFTPQTITCIISEGTFILVVQESYCMLINGLAGKELQEVGTKFCVTKYMLIRDQGAQRRRKQERLVPRLTSSSFNPSKET